MAIRGLKVRVGDIVQWVLVNGDILTVSESEADFVIHLHDLVNVFRFQSYTVMDFTSDGSTHAITIKPLSTNGRA